VLQAQRDTAWAEVARRLAHEIKNPLTPIQLSAERLEMKLVPRLADGDAEALRRSTQTIVNQVTAMKNMVNDFAIYARKPRPGSLQAIDVEALLKETLELYVLSGETLPALACQRADDSRRGDAPAASGAQPDAKRGGRLR
jgi:nitrogen fixation/metabolism regulation signal transduction histidine kinase